MAKLTKEQKKALRAKRKQEKKEKGLTLFNEFKTFILRGNVIDMSVGVIVGSAFGKITTTLTNSIFMPWVTYLLGDVSIEELKTVLRPEQLDAEGNVIVTEIALKWGEFLQTIIDFLLVALVIFGTVKVINYVRTKLVLTREKLENMIKKEQEEAQEAPAEAVVEEVVVETPQEVVPTTEDYLKEIRDLLKENLIKKEE